MTAPTSRPECSFPWYAGVAPSIAGRLAALVAVVLFMVGLELS